MRKEYHLKALAWAKDEDYAEGLRLWVERYGENIVYRALCHGANDFNRAKLRDGILKDVPETLEEPALPAAADPKVLNNIKDLEDSVDDLESNVDDLETNVADLKDTIYDLQEKVGELLESKKPLPLAKRSDPQENEPEEIRKMRESTYGLMDERTLLKQRLRDLPDPQRREERMVAAYRILDITQELDRLYGIIGYFEEFGRVPEKVGVEPEVIQYPKEYLNLRTYVSRTKTKLLTETDAGRRAQLQEKIETWIKRMEAIEIEL